MAKLSLAERIAARPKPRRLTWYDLLPSDEHRTEIDGVRHWFNSTEPAPKAAQVYRAVRAEGFPLNISSGEFSRWLLRGFADGQETIGGQAGGEVKTKAPRRRGKG